MKKAIAAAGLLLVSTAFSSAHAANLDVSYIALDRNISLRVSQNGEPVKGAVVTAGDQRAVTSHTGRASLLLSAPPQRAHWVKFVITAPDGNSTSIRRFVSRDD